MNASSSSGQTPTRRRGKSGYYLLGGVHLTDPPYLPFLLSKIVACTECGDGFTRRLPLLRHHLENATTASVRALQRQLNRYGPGHKDRIFPVDAIPVQLQGIYYLPWFLERRLATNPRSYGYWYGQPDARLEVKVDCGVMID
jgi:hypothetical protein